MQKEVACVDVAWPGEALGGCGLGPFFRSFVGVFGFGGLVPIVMSSPLHGFERRCCSSSCWMALIVFGSVWLHFFAHQYVRVCISMLQLINSTDLDVLAFSVFWNRCPVVREVASWAVVLLVSLVVQDSAFRVLLCTRGCFLAGFLPSLYLIQDPVVVGHAGGSFFLLCVWPSCRFTFCACLALWLDRDLSESNGVLCSVCSTCMFVLVFGLI